MRFWQMMVWTGILVFWVLLAWGKTVSAEAAEGTALRNTSVYLVKAGLLPENSLLSCFSLLFMFHASFTSFSFIMSFMYFMPFMRFKFSSFM